MRLSDVRGTRPQKENSTAKLTNSQEAEVEDARTKKLRNEIEQITLAAKGRVGVAAVVLETGETVSLSPHDHFPMQSVYKLPISMAVLKQVDAGKIKLDQKVSVTKTAIAKCFPFGSVMIPISLVAAVIPFLVPEVPVL